MIHKIHLLPKKYAVESIPHNTLAMKQGKTKTKEEGKDERWRMEGQKKQEKWGKGEKDEEGREWELIAEVETSMQELMLIQRVLQRIPWK